MLSCHMSCLFEDYSYQLCLNFMFTIVKPFWAYTINWISVLKTTFFIIQFCELSTLEDLVFILFQVWSFICIKFNLNVLEKYPGLHFTHKGNFTLTINTTLSLTLTPILNITLNFKIRGVQVDILWILWILWITFWEFKKDLLYMLLIYIAGSDQTYCFVFHVLYTNLN